MSETTGVTGTLDILNDEGVEHYGWNGDVRDRAVAREAFEAVLADGGVLAVVADSATKATQVRTWDDVEKVEAERGVVAVQVTRQVVGG